ncbi:MAG: sucrase [Candidatus Edwardsbacteria bacterium RifOxyC12_full_54_24]|nr:MAG: sucrase [Candidatus Edwardsbacteria bacterium RifOxyC12_full_54_24]
MNLRGLLAPVPSEGKFRDDDYFIWCASMVRDPEGMCHLFYSRWPRKFGFQAWVTHSEIAHAVSDHPTGPYKHVDVALPLRDAKYWDGLCTNNPTVHEFDGKYTLYYTGNTGDGKNTKGLNWTHRNNQRIGVAVADHPNGLWQRFDQPLIDVSEDVGAPDALMTNNPAICRRTDGTYVLVYKCAGKHKPLPFGGPVVHMVATSRSPTGPFRKHPEPIFTAKDDMFPAEDPYIWMQDGQLWAIVKDMQGSFTGVPNALALFQSKDGIDWALASTPLVSRPEVAWEGKGLAKLKHLERPQLWLEDGKPAVLFCAAMDGEDTFNVHIPMNGDANK